MTRLCEASCGSFASQRRRFGYRRLGLMWNVRVSSSMPRSFIGSTEGAADRPQGRRAQTSFGTRAPMTIPKDRNLCWSLQSGRRFRILTLVDDFTRECPALAVDKLPPAGASSANSIDRRTAQLSLHDRQRQRLTSDAILALKQERGVEWNFIGAAQTDAEWVRRELQRQTARRVSQRTPVRWPQRTAKHHRRMEDRLQHQSTHSSLK
jgi:hypothetical protein